MRASERFNIAMKTTCLQRQVKIDRELISLGGLDTVGKVAKKSNVSRIVDVMLVHVDQLGKITLKKP